MSSTRIVAVIVSALALAACGAATTVPSASPSASARASARATVVPTPSAKTYSPNDAAQVIRTTVTGARPLLIPNAIADDWKAEVTASASAFTATYRSPDGAKAVTLAIAAGNPPLPTAQTTQTHPSFHGDANSLYQVMDGTVARSDRQLLWIETGTWSVPGPKGVPYCLTANGLTDAEFWQIANSLHPNQI